jgi:hypothetical protein
MASGFRRIDRSAQTDARAKPARPDAGAASGASDRAVLKRLPRFALEIENR